MAILKNKKGIKGEETAPVVCPYDFMNAVFNIEKKYGSNEKFTIIKDGVPRHHLLHHLNNADLQLATILLKTCNTNGKITQVSRYSIYESLVEHYENPIQAAAFYTSIEKFKLHGIITETKTEHTGKYNYQLNPYLNPETGKIGMFVALPSLVFTKEFDANLDIAQKKLFYSVYIQQNEKYKPADPIVRNLHTHKENVQFSGLYNFLHRKDPYQVRMVLDGLLETLVQGKPLFSRAQMLKSGKAYYKAEFLINPEIFPSKEEKGIPLHEPIPVRLVYPRKSNFIRKLLAEWKISELVLFHKQGKSFLDLVHILKNQGYRVIRHAIYQIKKFFDETNRLPADFVKFIEKEIRSKTLSSVMSAACKMGVVDFIAPIQNTEERKNREFDFASSLSRHHIGVRKIEKMFAMALPLLKELYGRPAIEHLALTDYRVSYPALLEIELGQVVNLARVKALKSNKHPRHYVALEENAVDVYHRELRDGIDFRDYSEWFLREVEKLPEIEIVPVLPLDFKLEDFIVQKFLGQVY
ncbi:hypothetical protein ACFPOG_12795 [Paenibacillus aestuarii]|uniref:Helicase XPB/Ssl2 N-terminal domain-containing protein n=1 Tax=Paenibacillus aestuarii TaxID=516965 RepID=A0ABW0K743_9BACL